MAYRLVVLMLGGADVVLALLLVPLPGHGWVTVLGGLFVLATEFTWAQRPLDFTSQQVVRWTAQLREQPVVVRFLVATGAVAVVFGLAALAVHILGVPTWATTLAAALADG